MEINQNLRSLVFGNSCKNLFSFGLDEEEIEHSKEETLQEDIKVKKDLFEDFGTLFFFPKKNPIYKQIKVFSREKDYARKWDELRQDLTNEFKRKHKSAFKRSKRLRK